MNNVLNKNKFKLLLFSFLAGFLNGIFGAGGGILIVPLLESLKIKTRIAHATSVAIIAIFCIVSFLGCCFCGYFDFFRAIRFVPAGVAGALVGSLVLRKINGFLLRKFFALILIISSIRLFFK